MVCLTVHPLSALPSIGRQAGGQQQTGRARATSWLTTLARTHTGFKHGKMPSNKQCDVALNSALNSKALSNPSKELSEEGQKLVQDLRDVIDQSRKLILSKNDGHLIQEFIYNAQHLGSVEVNKPGAPVDKDGAKRDGNEALDGLKTLGTLLITNGEFRKICKNIYIYIYP